MLLNRVFLLSLFIFSITASADSPPTSPNDVYGKVTIDGKVVPGGTLVSIKEITQYDTFYYTTTTSMYGWYGPIKLNAEAGDIIIVNSSCGDSFGGTIGSMNLDLSVRLDINIDNSTYSKQDDEDENKMLSHLIPKSDVFGYIRYNGSLVINTIAINITEKIYGNYTYYNTTSHNGWYGPISLFSDVGDIVCISCQFRGESFKECGVMGPALSLQQNVLFKGINSTIPPKLNNSSQIVQEYQITNNTSNYTTEELIDIRTSLKDLLVNNGCGENEADRIVSNVIDVRYGNIEEHALTSIALTKYLTQNQISSAFNSQNITSDKDEDIKVGMLSKNGGFGINLYDITFPIIVFLALAGIFVRREEIFTFLIDISSKIKETNLKRFHHLKSTKTMKFLFGSIKSKGKDNIKALPKQKKVKKLIKNEDKLLEELKSIREDISQSGF